MNATKDLSASPQRKGVTFSPRPLVRELSQKGSLTDKWYGKDDYRSFAKRNMNIVYFLRTCGASSSPLIEMTTGDAIRGLEAGYPGVGKKKKDTIEQCVDIVLEEQDYQRELGISDSEVIASAYRVATLESRMEAFNCGLRDETDARADAARPRDEDGSCRDIERSEISCDGSGKSQSQHQKNLISPAA